MRSRSHVGRHIHHPGALRGAEGRVDDQPIELRVVVGQPADPLQEVDDGLGHPGVAVQRATGARRLDDRRRVAGAERHEAGDAVVDGVGQDAAQAEGEHRAEEGVGLDRDAQLGAGRRHRLHDGLDHRRGAELLRDPLPRPPDLGRVVEVERHPGPLRAAPADDAVGLQRDRVAQLLVGRGHGRVLGRHRPPGRHRDAVGPQQPLRRLQRQHRPLGPGLQGVLDDGRRGLDVDPVGSPRLAQRHAVLARDMAGDAAERAPRPARGRRRRGCASPWPAARRRGRR